MASCDRKGGLGNFTRKSRQELPWDAPQTLHNWFRSGTMYVVETNKHFTCAESVPQKAKQDQRCWKSTPPFFGKCGILKTSHGLSSKSEPFAMPIFRKSHCTILRHLVKVDLEASPGKALRRLEVGESQGGQVSKKNLQKMKIHENDIRIKRHFKWKWN